MPHPTRLIRHGDFEAEIDEDLAALVLALWRAGIDTASACQDEAESNAEVGGTATADHHGRSYVDFLSLDDALRFYDAVADGSPAGDDQLYQRLASLATPGAWETRVTVFDTRLTSGTGDLSAPSRFAAGVARVRFPRTDIDEITNRLSQTTRS